MKKYFFFFLFSFLTVVSHAQFLVSDVDPSSLKWLQINTPHFQIIYPEDFKSQAQRVANIFEYSATPVSKTMNSVLPKIPVVIHSQTAISNGMTAMAPRRIELYPIPYQGNMYTHNWYEQLAVHEYRHFCQFNKLNVGFTKTASVLFGQAATAVASAMIPTYFYEGDAVLTETALSNSGRGRQPFFQMETRAYMLEKNKFYSYRKAMLGSFRNYIPDHYQFGYLYVASAREKYGSRVWEHVLSRVGQNPFSYRGSFKTMTGKNSNGLYKESFKHLDELWRKQDNEIKKTPYNLITKRESDTYTSYNFPALYNESIIIAVKSGIDDLTHFVKIYPDGQEETIITPGRYQADNLSCSKNTITWNEYIPDIRWGERSYSVIKTLDLKTGVVNNITNNTKYFYPIISPDATKIAVVEYNQEHQYSITIINAISGLVISKHLSPQNLFPVNPCWDSDGKHVYVIQNADAGKKILSVDIQNNKWKTIFAPKFWEMYQLYSQGDWIYFRSGYSGIENIFAVNKNSSKAYQVTSSQFGAFDPHVKNNQLYYSNYTANGYDIVNTTIDTTKWQPDYLIVPHNVDLNETASLEELNIVDSSTIPSTIYPERKYSKLKHLFNVHSWLPFYNDWTNLSPAPIMVIPGITVFSQNALSTAVTYAGAGYGLIRKEPFYFGGITYSGFYPVINIEGSYGGDQQITNYTIYKEDTLPSQNLVARTYLPLNLSRGAITTIIQPEIGGSFTNSKTTYSDGTMIYGSAMQYGRIQYLTYLKKAFRDIAPRLGITLDASFRQSFLHPKDDGHFFNGKGVIYIPGLLKHQTIKLSGTINYVKEGFSSIGSIRPARGYDESDTIFNKTYKYFNNLSKFSVDYITPLLYPDLNIIHVLYIKRIWTSLFYDYSYGQFYNKNFGQLFNAEHQSYGAEFYMDFHLFHSFVPFSIGYRISFLSQENNKAVGFLIFSIGGINF